MSTEFYDANILAHHLHEGNVVFFTGAGVSTESGIPDYRSPREGLWLKYDPGKLANPQALRNNYEEFREFYQFRIKAFEGIEPNIGHQLIRKWQNEGRVAAVITQNIDGLHGEDGVTELHGRLNRIVCADCGEVSDVQAFLSNEDCPHCRGPLRPDVVLFGEDLPSEQMTYAKKMAKQCSAFVVLGSSLSVSPANQLPKIAKQARRALYIVSREPTELDWIAHHVVRCPIGEFLQAVEAELQKIEAE